MKLRWSRETSQQASTPLPSSREDSIVDVSLPFPIWYNSIFGYLPKNGEFDRLMANWSSTARTYGEGSKLVGLDAQGQLRRVSFEVQGSVPPAGRGVHGPGGLRRGAPLRKNCRLRSFTDHDARRHRGGSTGRAPCALVDIRRSGYALLRPAGVVEYAAQRAGLGRGIKLVALQSGAVDFDAVISG